MVFNYSLAVMPPPHIADLVKEHKAKLKAEIGKSYGSVNAEAHITLDSFDGEEDVFPLVLAEYQRLVFAETPMEVLFSGFGHFEGYHPSFHIKLTDESKERLRGLYARVRQGFNPQIRKRYMRKWLDESKEPHMTIGRRLLPEWIEKAYAVFPVFEEKFTCDQLSIRQYRPELKQYKVVETLAMRGDNAFTSSLFG